MENIYIGARCDRYGSNTIPYISYVLLSKINNCNLYHNCSYLCGRYKKNILHRFLITKTKTTRDKNIINKDCIIKGAWDACNKIYSIAKKPFPDIFHNSSVFHEIRNLYFNKYKKSFTENATIIHVRLGDVEPSIKQTRRNKQQFIGSQNLIHLINFIYEKFKTPIYLMTTPNKKDIEICYECLKKSKYKSENHLKNILGSRDMDYDIFLMLTSKHLITSRSTFSFIPALLHKRIVYTYTDWKHYRDLIGTCVDGVKSEKFQILDWDFGLEKSHPI